MFSLILATMLLQQPSQPLENAVSPLAMMVSTEEAKSHLIGEQPILRIKTMPKEGYFYSALRIDVMVEKDGSVLWAAAEPGYGDGSDEGSISPETVLQAESIVRTLRFVAFRRGGLPVPAMFQQNVLVLPPELKPRYHIPAPKVQSWRSVRISLWRVGAWAFARLTALSFG